ncbi:hypothetical protein L6R52_44020, partial [Myxococcota bacterium]|nr:hypothetical protein [Myxococcota bacterium]
VERARSSLVAVMRTDPDAGVRMSAERAVAKLGDRRDAAVVAVLPLANRTGLGDADVARLGVEVAEYVAARLSSSKVCQVIEPEKLEVAIRELKKVGAPMYDGDAPSAPAIGRFKIASELVFGSVQRQGSTFTIVLDRMELSTLTRVPGAAVTVSGYRPDLEQLKQRAAEQLVATFR